jgi:plastocyanin
MYYHTIIFGVYFFVFPFLLKNTVNAQQQTNIHPVMYKFSKSISSISNDLPAGDATLLLPHVIAMHQASQELDNVNPQKNTGIAYLFNEYRTEIKNLSYELLVQIKNENLSQVPQILSDIRQTCVTCHIKFRNDNDHTGQFPNTGSVIHGKVKILKFDGNERIDRSNVVLFLDHVPADTLIIPNRPNLVISQENRQFDPRVISIVKGTTVDFPNDDIVFHNVFSLSKSKSFDLDIYSPGELKTVTFSRTGWVKVYCNIHPSMIAHIIVLDNPYFDQTDEMGLFVIPDVPAGDYIIRVWHEFGSEIRKNIHISDALQYNINFEIQEDKRFIQHKNKFGDPYDEKY